MKRADTFRTSATRGFAVIGIAALIAAPIAPDAGAMSPPTVTHEVALTATAVPPGGLITSFIGNQIRYCSIICPLLVETAATAAATTVQSPFTFLTAVQSGDLLRAIGVAAASVTGPTNAAAQAAILADGSMVAPRALNAFEVGVVGLLDVLPATAEGLPGIFRALQVARENTYTAMNLPIVANPTPTVNPRGVLQVAVVETINVGAAIVFPAFNHVLSAVFEAPDAFAQELARSGDPVRALAAGIHAVAVRVGAAVTVVADAVVTGLHNVGAAIEETQEPSADEAEPTEVDDTSTAVDPPAAEEDEPVRRPVRHKADIISADADEDAPTLDAEPEAVDSGETTDDAEPEDAADPAPDTADHSTDSSDSDEGAPAAA